MDRKRIIAAALAATLSILAPVHAGEIRGPARFCGYSPIIDLRDGEKIIPLEGGIHGGSFRWEGAFGVLEVHGIGWARRPKGRIVKAYSAGKPARFAPRKVEGKYQVAIWNDSHGAAYFTSLTPFTASQVAAMDRVALFEEGENPPGCDLRTIFSWE